MASAALPGIFPAIRLGDHWYGDGGIRLTAPLSPALHLGAKRILAVSTRFEGSQEDEDTPDVSGYPPPAQIISVLSQSIFLDTLDQDARRLARNNRFLEALPERHRQGFQPIRHLILRPSQDLSRLAREYEPRLPRGFRFLTRGLGTRRTSRPDVLAMMMFQPDYLRRLIDLGESDTEARLDELTELLGPDTRRAAPEEAAPGGRVAEG